MRDRVDISFFLSFRVAVILPAAQAIVSGFLVGYITVAWSYFAHSNAPWANGALTSSATAVIAWIMGMAWWRSKIAIYLPTPQATGRVKLEWQENDGRTLHFDELPATPEQLEQIGKMVLAGTTLSQGNMLKVFGGSRPAVQQFQAALIRQGYARWRNAQAPTQGIESTRRGMRMFAQIIAPSPTLQDKLKGVDLRGNTRARGRRGDHE